jgi:hypothetical protein
MNTPLRVGMAAVIGLLLLGAGIYFFGPREPGGVGGAPIASPTPSPSPLVTGPVSAGTYGIGAPFAIDGIALTVPDGWQVDSFDAERVDLSLPEAGSAPAWLTFNVVDEVYPDPCGAPGVPTSTPLGPSVDDLVAALSDLQGYEAGPVTDVTVGGLPARSFELNDAADTTCEPGTLIGLANNVDTNSPSRLRMVVMNVNGQRLLIRSMVLPDGAKAMTPEAYAAAIAAVIETIAID